VPITASFFVEGWLWTGSDYVFAWALFAGAGLGYSLVASRGNSAAYKAAVGLGVLGVFLLVWVNGAVGIIGSEDNPANAMYLGVLIAGFLGLMTSRLEPRGMAVTMFIVATVQMLVPVIALMVWKPAFADPPGVVGVFMLNAVFAALWAGSGLLFRRASQEASGM
jgi:hypothetical protein